jgi:rubrerythrin
MYDEFAKTAKKEGYNQIAMLFEKVGAIEKSHQLRYDNLSKTLKKNSVFVEKKEIY